MNQSDVKPTESTDTKKGGIPKGLGYSATRKWLILNGRADEAELMRVKANEASLRSKAKKSGTSTGADPIEKLQKSIQAQEEKIQALQQLVEIDRNRLADLIKARDEKTKADKTEAKPAK